MSTPIIFGSDKINKTREIRTYTYKTVDGDSLPPVVVTIDSQTKGFTLEKKGDYQIISPYLDSFTPPDGIYNVKTSVDLTYKIPELIKLHFELHLTTSPGYLYPQGHRFTVTYDGLEKDVPSYPTSAPEKAVLLLNLNNGNILELAYEYNSPPDDQTIQDTFKITHMGQSSSEPDPKIVSITVKEEV